MEQREEMVEFSRRNALAATIAVGAFAATPVAMRAQAFPGRPIRVIIPLAAAGATDVAIRMVLDEMGRELGQTFVVENQPGASGLVGMRSGARANADGYTILGVNDSIMTMLPTMKDGVGYDPLLDFSPITQLVKINFALIAHPSFAASSVKDLIGMAREKPGSIDYASGGPGSPQNVAMELLAHATQIKLNHVPYRGVAQAFNDVVGGHVPLMITGLPSPNEFINKGQLKLLGITSAQRSAVFPNQPTIAEQGVAGYDFTTYAALVAPAKTPSEIIALLNRSAIKALNAPTVNSRLSGMGFEIIANTSAEFTAALKEGLAKYSELSKAANIRL
jgi:tripartite-type tricarboxylate transporter receptor subunit TctC